MRILDLFCGAGGAAMGYRRAFPDAVIIGVDINPQPHYPFRFVLGDAMGVLERLPLARLFDLVHASPPCQASWESVSIRSRQDAISARMRARTDPVFGRISIAASREVSGEPSTYAPSVSADVGRG